MKGMTVRLLTPADAAVYRELMLEAYDAHPDAFTSSVVERAALPLSWWEARLSAGSSAKELVWGSLDSGRLVGVAGLSLNSREKLTHKATLFGMYVQPPMRGGGRGDALVGAVIDHARSREDLEVVQLTVTAGNAAALALYVRHGFLEFGVEPYAVRVSERFVSKIHMWRLVTS